MKIAWGVNISKPVIVLLTVSLTISSCTSDSTPAPRLIVAATRTQLPSQTTTPIPTKSILSGCVNVSSLRVRSGPGTQYGMVDGLSSGDCLSLDGRNKTSTWVRILSSDSWVAAEFLELSGRIGTLPVRQPRIAVVATGPSSGGSSPTSGAPVPTQKAKASYILASDARAYIGQNVTIRIGYAYCFFDWDLPATFCNDQRFPNHHFTMLKWDKDWSEYDGICILVSGKVSTFQGKPQIIVGSRSQVSTC